MKYSDVMTLLAYLALVDLSVEILYCCGHLVVRVES